MSYKALFALAAAHDLELEQMDVKTAFLNPKLKEIIYIHGQENDPVALDHHSPVLHLIQTIRDEAHRFAVTFHRKRRQMRDRDSELLQIPGIGARTRQRLVEHFGSMRAVQQADSAALSAVVTKPQAEAILNYFSGTQHSGSSTQHSALSTQPRHRPGEIPPAACLTTCAVTSEH